MSGGSARASGTGDGSTGNVIEFEDPFDDARKQVAGLQRKRDRLMREHDELVESVGAERVQGTDQIRALELEDSAAQQSLAQEQQAAASKRRDLVAARCTQTDLVNHGDDTQRVNLKRVQRAQVDVQYTEVTLAKLESEEAEEASAQAAQATQVTQSAQTAQTALEPEPDEDECSVCLEIIPGRDRVQITKCKHSSFCQSCLWRLIQDDQKCPFCRGDLDEYHPLWKKMRLR